MSDETTCFEPPPLPALMRAARNVYAAAIHEALLEAGYDDVPRNGVYVIGSLARLAGAAGPLGRIIRDLRVSKQAAGQLVDMLVLRGYLERTVDPEDRRRLTVALTERGQAAAAATRAAVERIDGELVARIGAERVAEVRRALHALVEIGLDAAAPEDAG